MGIRTEVVVGFLGQLRTLKGRLRRSVPAFHSPTREWAARTYLRGRGLEIGALHNPLKVPSTADVTYVDRLPVAELRRQYPELAEFKLVPVDLIDDGERLAKVANASLDFVIANHFLEHCQDPIGTVLNLCRVLRAGGVLYLAVPDKRYTFDRDRPVTPLSHLIQDHENGPLWSRRQHFEEWTRLVNKVKDDQRAEAQIQHLMQIDYSIHYHVWTQTEFLELFQYLRNRVSLDIELFQKHGIEIIVVLRKARLSDSP